MEDAQKNIQVKSSLSQPQPKESEAVQSAQPDPPPLQQFDQKRHLPNQNTLQEQPEKHKQEKCNTLQPPAGPQHPLTLPSERSSQAQPEQPNLVHSYLAQPVDDPHLTQSKDRPHPDQGPPTSLALDQSSLSSPDQSSLSSADQSSLSSPDQSSLSSPDQSSLSSADQSSLSSADQSSLSSPDDDKPKKKGDPNKLSLLTWNIDGLDMENIKERFSKLLDYIIKYHPDIVLLQEVISPTYQVLQQVLKPYHVLPGSDRSYFTAILLRKSRVQLLGSSIVNYPDTKMSRNLLVANVSFLGRPLCVMTSHLESRKPSSLERQNQLRILWRTMREQPPDHNVIFGGDTNLRDWEVKNQGGVPEGIRDVWESLGRLEFCRYTWDCVTNDNKDLPFPARHRFDRLFLRQAGEGSKFSPDGLSLVGLKRLECDRFVSDHWGLLCTFVIEPLRRPTP